MALFKRFLRILKYTLLVVLAFAVGAVAVLTLTGKGRENLAGLISDLASTPERQVTISGMDGIWSGNFSLEQLVVADADGPWLAVKGLELQWSPASLLWARFDAARIAAQRIELARLPKPSKEAAPADSGSSSLPVDISIGALDFPDIALGQAVTGGQVASVAAKGKANVQGSPLSVAADVNVSRTDGTAGDVLASIDFAPADNRLEVDVKASEPSGGILANLLKLPGKPAVNIIVTGSGPMENWRGNGSFSVDGNRITSVSATHRLTDAGRAVEARGDGEFTSFLPERLRPLLAGKTTFDVAGTLTKEGGVQISRGSIESDALSATAAGSFNPTGATDLSVDVAAKNNGVLLGFGTEESPIDIVVGQATVRALGDGREPGLDISANLPSVSTNDVKLANLGITLQSDAFNLTERGGPVTGSVVATSLTIDNPTVSPLVAGEIRAQLEGALTATTLTVSKGSLRSDAIDGRFAGDVSLPDGAITLQLDADVVSAALPAGARPLLGEKVALATSLERDKDGNVSAHSLSVRSGGLTTDGAVRIGGGQIDADIKGGLADISPLAEQASGAIGFSVTAKGALATPDVALTVSSDKMTVAARDIENLELSATAKADLANPEANVTLKGTVAGETLDGKAVLNTADGRRAVRDLSLSLGKNRIAGSLALDDKFIPDGTVNFDLPDLGPLAALALEKVEGSVKGSVAFTRPAAGPQAKISATSAAITRGDLSVKSVAIDALIDNYTSAPGIAGTVRVDEVMSGKTAIRGIGFKLARENEWTRFDGGAQLNDIPLKAAGRVKVAGGTTTVELASAEATMRGIRAALARATTVRIAGGQTTLDKLTLALGSGSAVISGTAGTALNLDVVLSRLPASLANAFAPGLDAAGTISGTVKVSGAAANPTVGYAVDWGGAETAQTRGAGIGALAIKSNGTFASNRLTFDTNLGNGSGLAIKGGGTVAIATPPQLNLKFDGTLPFGLLASKLAAQGFSLTGNAALNVAVSGAATRPVISGSVRSSGARFVDAQSGIAVNDIALDVGIGSGRATINRLSGGISSGGSVSASGWVGIEPDKGFPADIAIKLADARYTDGQIVTTTFSGNLAVQGQLATAPKIGGTIDLAKTVITVPERLPGSLASLNVKHKNAPAAVAKQDKAIRPASTGGGKGGGGGLSLDLTVNAPGRIFVQGRGLDAELGGSLRLVGPAASPQATGQFTMRRGRLSLLGKRLTFTRGTLGFSGSLVPYLDLAAESSANDATVTVAVTGPANNPKFGFSSIPALPEDEVLARLIFGRSMSNLSPLQIAQLADAAAQLAGGGGTTGLLNSLRDRLGVDDLDVKTNEEGDTTVSVGKYLNDRTYVTIEKGDKAGSGRAAIDLDVGRGVKLRGEARDDGEARGGIFLEREY